MFFFYILRVHNLPYPVLLFVNKQMQLTVVYTEPQAVIQISGLFFYHLRLN